jgi:hypothetical protein
MAKGQVKQKKTKECLEKLDYAFSIDASIREACYYADISEAIYYHWVKNDPKLLERFNRLKNKPVLKARQNIANNLNEGDILTSKWYLERKVKKEFGQNLDIVSDGKQINTVASMVELAQQKEKE